MVVVPSQVDISLILPTYNERQNLRKVVEGIDAALRDRYEIVVVDDSSPDGTIELAWELSEQYPLKVVRREKKDGLASAVVYGFGFAKGSVIGVIDADLQHPPDLIPRMISRVRDGADIVLASRYVEGGSAVGFSRWRKLVSLVATLLARPLSSVSDPQSGFFVMRGEVISKVRFAPAGFKILLEILVKGDYDEVVEVPYTFLQRANGSSKLTWREVSAYLGLIARLHWCVLKRSLTRR